MSVVDNVTIYGLASLGVSLLSVPVTVWCILLGVYASRCCAIGPFRDGDAHPLLAPAATMAFSWLATSA